MRRIAGLIPVLVALSVVSPASAAFPGSVGRIAFDDGSNVFTAQPNGARLVQLTADGDSHNPRWSPDGRRIAFDRGGFIYVMSASGGNVHRATLLGNSYQPAWSADGKRLAFVHIPVGKPGDIWTVPASGGSARRGTFDPSSSCGDSHPVWSPAGGIIAFDQQPGTWVGGGACQSGDFRRVVVLRLADRTRYPIEQAWDPDFTADGKGLFFTSRQEPEGFTGADNLYASDL